MKNVKLAPFHAGRCAEISVGNTIIGYAGEFNPSILEKNGISGKVYGFEINVDVIVNNSQDLQAPIFSAMPVVKEDFAFVVSKDVTAREMTETIEKALENFLKVCVCLMSMKVPTLQRARNPWPLVFDLELPIGL